MSNIDSTNVLRWYEGALKQIAAESYLAGTAFTDRNEMIRLLQDGNTPPGSAPAQYVRMTASQATDFLNKYEIVDQCPDTSSEFSATLLRDKSTGSYSLVFRSTEWKNFKEGGDYQRDGYPGAGGDIASAGFAFGQLRDMEWYLGELKAGRLVTGTSANGQAVAQYLASNGQFEVEGYSLGAHLATVFTELHASEGLIKQTILFNAAGRGAIGAPTQSTQGQSIRDVLNLFEAVLNNPQDPRLASVLWSEQELSLQSAAIGTHFATPREGGPLSAPNSIYTSAAYQWARAATQRYFDLKSQLLSPGRDTGLDPAAVSLITQLYGHATHDDQEFVANSGIHAPASPIFIEDQPEVEGLPKFPFASDLTASFTGDFGNTHSLTLIVDSLAVMNAFMTIDPSLTQRQVETILAAASNQRAKGIVALSAPDAAEGNSLEKALDALRKLFVTPGHRNGQTINDANDPRWETPFDSRAGGFGDRNVRNDFYQNLQDLLAANIAGQGYSIESLVPASSFFDSGVRNGEPKPDLVSAIASQLIPKAHQMDPEGLSYRYALNELNPFVVIDTQNKGLYSRFQLGGTNAGELDLYDPASEQGRKGLTEFYLQDRADFLERKLYITTLNLTKFYETPNISDPNTVINAVEARGQAYQREAKHFEDRPSGFIASDGSLNRNSQQHLIFGGSSVDAIEGAGREDHLYGGAGTDWLDGKADNDYLEGGTGLDLYQYGGSRNFLGIPSNDGTDTILDADGKGALRYSFTQSGAVTNTVIADASVKVSDTEWQSADGKFKYVTSTNAEGGTDLTVTILGDAEGTMVLKDWRDGDFGIRLWEARTAPVYAPTANVVPGGNDQANTLTGTAAADLILAFGEDDRVNALAGDDIVEGGAGNDVLGGDADNDRLYGEEGDDQITGGLGDDEVYGGADRDFVTDAGGANLLEGGAGNDYLDGGSAKLTPTPFINRRRAETRSAGRLGALAIVLITATFVGCAGYVPGRQAYWDEQVKAMCDKEGGIKVFHIVELNAKEYDKLLNDRGQIDLPNVKDAKPDQKFVYSSETEYVVRGSVEVRKYVTKVLHRVDGLVLAERVSFGRVGGDPPLGIGHHSHFLCPSNDQNLFEKPFKRV